MVSLPTYIIASVRPDGRLQFGPKDSEVENCKPGEIVPLDKAMQFPSRELAQAFCDEMNGFLSILYPTMPPNIWKPMLYAEAERVKQ